MSQIEKDWVVRTVWVISDSPTDWIVHILSAWLWQRGHLETSSCILVCQSCCVCWSEKFATSRRKYAPPFFSSVLQPRLNYASFSHFRSILNIPLGLILHQSTCSNLLVNIFKRCLFRLHPPLAKSLKEASSHTFWEHPCDPNVFFWWRITSVGQFPKLCSWQSPGDTCGIIHIPKSLPWWILIWWVSVGAQESVLLILRVFFRETLL